jgi:hypothetical protein
MQSSPNNGFLGLAKQVGIYGNHGFLSQLIIQIDWSRNRVQTIDDWSFQNQYWWHILWND